MNSFFGHLLCQAALAVACLGLAVALAESLRPQLAYRRWLVRASAAFAALMLLANGTMVEALLAHDFSVAYVAQVGSRLTPPLYSVASLWSSLEGSILLWGLILAAYIAAFARACHHRLGTHFGPAMIFLLATAAFFALLLVVPADPFRLVPTPPADGPGPNPLLQNHILMVIHPPILYLGYVGMCVPFAIAMAALWRAELPLTLLALMRQWTLLPWAMLSVGIILGSWWAYEVLGWGGYWAWDPVENASFLPWLSATAFLHSAVVQQRRQILKGWTVTLVLSTFLLTILGTFMTRSGVFNSVHSFTQSSIGPAFLVFLALMSAAGVVLLGLRGHLMHDEGRLPPAISREVVFLANNVVFVVFTLTVLLGTVYPLLAEAMGGNKVSVGEPYFDRMALPIGLSMVFLMGVGPALPWGQPRAGRAWAQLWPPAAAGVLTMAGLWAAGLAEGLALCAFGLCAFAAYTTLRELWLPIAQRAASRQLGRWAAAAEVIGRDRRRVGGYVVHLAVILVVMAIAGSQAYRQDAEAQLEVGQSMSVGPYQLTFLRAHGEQQPQRFAVIGVVRVSRGGKVLGLMRPRMHFYPSQREPVGTPHVATLGQADLYLSLLSVSPDAQSVGIKAYYVPLVAWIWRSLPLWVLGAGFGLWPRGPRRRRLPLARAPQPA